MPYQIDAELSSYLLQQPEYGMGFQLAIAPAATAGDNEPQQYAIINATWALAMDQQWRPEPEELEGFDNYTSTLAATSSAPATKVLVEQPIAFPETFPFGRDDISLRTHGSFPATVSKPQRFCRFSAYSNDRRIRPDSTLYPGTYITSANDAEYVNTGLSAVARYALPMPTPAIFRFDVTIQPEPPDKAITLMCGTVKPDHDQSGGGIEFRTPDRGRVVASKKPKVLPAW